MRRKFPVTDFDKFLIDPQYERMTLKVYYNPKGKEKEVAKKKEKEK